MLTLTTTHLSIHRLLLSHTAKCMSWSFMCSCQWCNFVPDLCLKF